MSLLNKADRINYIAFHQGFKRYLANTSWLFAEKVFKMVVGFFVVIWVARYLGPEKFGLLSYAQNFVELFSAIATLGLNEIVVRELVKDESRRDELLGAVFWLKVMGGFGVLLLVAIAVNFTSNDWYTNLIVFIIASGTVFQAFNVVGMYFQAKVMGKYITYANALSLFTGSLFKIYLILSEAPLIYFAWAIVFDSVVLALGYTYFYLFMKGSIRSFLTFKKSTAVSLLKESWPLILSGILIMIQVRIDQVMIQQMLGNSEVGHYSVAVRSIEYFNFLSVILNQSLFPALIRNGQMDIERFKMLYKLQFYLGVLVAIVLVMFGKFIIVKLYGIVYEPAALLFILYAWRVPTTSLAMVRGAYITIHGFFKYSLFLLFTSSIINIVLNFLMIPVYGAEGAIFATLICTLYIFLADLLHPGMKKNFMLMVQAILFKR